jgi:hypothetical protein
MAEDEKQAAKILRLIKGHDDPPGTLVDELKKIETSQRELRKQIEAETLELQSATPPLESYDRLRSEFAGRVWEPDFRSVVRQLIRSITDKIVVELGQDRYEVHLKGSRQPIEVVLCGTDWVFRPAPLLVTDPCLFEKMDVAGHFTNRLPFVA